MAWIIQSGQLVNTDAVGVPDTPFHGDSPYTFWRIDPNANEGMPYVGLMIGVPVLNPEPPVVAPNVYYGNIRVSNMCFGSCKINAVYFGENRI